MKEYTYKVLVGEIEINKTEKISDQLYEHIKEEQDYTELIAEELDFTDEIIHNLNGQILELRRKITELEASMKYFNLTFEGIEQAKLTLN